jgi:adenylylsulfate kinase
MLYRQLIERGVRKIEVLDGDVVRTHLSKGLGFSRADRDTNILRIGWVCELLIKHGVPNIVAAISPYRDSRNEVRAMVEKVGGVGSFVEVWVKCPVDQCIKRDVKGLYAKAIKGEIHHFTGVSDSYEEPKSPEIVVPTDHESPAESVERVMQFVQRFI